MGKKNLCTWILCVKDLQQVSMSVCELTWAFRSFLSNTHWLSIIAFRFFPSTCTFTGSPISQLPAGRCMINICCNKIRISACFSSILWSGFIYLKCRLKLQEFGLCQGELWRFDLEGFLMFHHLFLQFVDFCSLLWQTSLQLKTTDCCSCKVTTNFGLQKWNGYHLWICIRASCKLNAKP